MQLTMTIKNTLCVLANHNFCLLAAADLAEERGVVIAGIPPPFCSSSSLPTVYPTLYCPALRAI